jgi:hypothetical protein
MPNYFGQQNYRIHTVAFYNFENLFDTMIQLLMMMNGHQKRKALDIKKVPPKLENLSRVLLEIDLQKTQFTHFIACSEIENRGVLEDLIKQPKLIPKDYGIIHFDSPDKRGIDVACCTSANFSSYLIH